MSVFNWHKLVLTLISILDLDFTGRRERERKGREKLLVRESCFKTYIKGKSELLIYPLVC